jgi:hypothetical protein
MEFRFLCKVVQYSSEPIPYVVTYWILRVLIDLQLASLAVPASHPTFISFWLPAGPVCMRDQCNPNTLQVG